MWPENECTSYVSNQINGFCDVDPNATSLKYSMYMLANTGKNGNPIASPSCQYISDPILNEVVSTQNVNISIRLLIWMPVHSSRKGSAANLSYITIRISSLGTVVNRLTISRLTIRLEWMGESLIFSHSMQSSWLMTYLLVCWLSLH